MANKHTFAKPASKVARLRWEKLAFPFHIGVDVKAMALRSIKNDLRSVGDSGFRCYRTVAVRSASNIDCCKLLILCKQARQAPRAPFV